MLAWTLLAAAAWAADPLVVTHIDDVHRLVREGAVPHEIAAAVGTSSYGFLPRHAYALLDARAPADVVRAVHAKAGVYWDASLKPLADVQAAARMGAPTVTHVIESGNLLGVFEILGAAAADRERVLASLGAKPTRQAGETDYAFDQRARTWALAQAKALGPVEGRLEAITFELRLPAVYGPVEPDGCLIVTAIVDVHAVAFFDFRNAMGTTLQRNDVDLGKVSKTVASMTWIGDDRERIEAESIRLCGPAVGGLTGQAARLEATVRRKAAGGFLADAAEFVDARTGSRVRATF